MNKIVLGATLAFVFVTPLLAQEPPANSNAMNAVDRGAESVPHNASVSPLPSDVADRIAQLRKFGSRFEKAIRLIELEATTPGWQFEDDNNQEVPS